jgi:hypothetical protein
MLRHLVWQGGLASEARSPIVPGAPGDHGVPGVPGDHGVTIGRTSGIDMVNVFARMCLLIGAILLIAGCAGYNESTMQEIRREGEIKAQETGQPSMLQGWRPQYEGAI